MAEELNVLEKIKNESAHYRVLVDRAPVYVSDCPFSKIIESNKEVRGNRVYCQLDNSEGCELRNNHACDKIMVIGSL